MKTNKETIKKALYKFTLALKDYKKDELSNDDFATSIEFMFTDLLEAKDKEKMAIIESFSLITYAECDYCKSNGSNCECSDNLYRSIERSQEEQKQLIQSNE